MPRMVIGFAESALRDLEEVQAWYTEQGVSGVANACCFFPQMVIEDRQRSEGYSN